MYVCDKADSINPQVLLESIIYSFYKMKGKEPPTPPPPVFQFLPPSSLGSCMGSIVCILHRDDTRYEKPSPSHILV